MTDKLTPQQRHVVMAAIHGKDTKPELLVRRFLWSRGYRYRLNHPRLPGKPDIVLRKYRTCIFVNGCFWHGHEGCGQYSIPKTNTDFWLEKIERNKERDVAVRRQLASMGWHSVTVWECELRPKVRRQTLESLDYMLTDILLRNYGATYYDDRGEDTLLSAAEEEAPYNATS